MSFIAGIVKRFRRLASGLKEKPTAQLEDFEFEHFLLYHGLVGSSPDNERSFRDVRHDINEAVKNQSSAELCIALKLPPLWWDDKLESIFGEMGATTGSTGQEYLIPESGQADLTDDSIPLRHSDWRVRSNAARISAAMGWTAAVPEIALALADDSLERRAAFCHLAYSLGKLATEEARLALKPYLSHDESWFRVDAAGALSNWQAGVVGHDLMTAMLNPHRLSDYTAVSIARKHKPRIFMEMSDETVQDGGVEMVISLLQAAQNTFPPEIAYELGVAHSLPIVCQLAKAKPTPRRLRAALELSKFLSEQDQISVAEREQADELVRNDVDRTVSEWLSQSGSKQSFDPSHTGEILHALWLAGERKQTNVLQHIIPMLSAQNAWLQASVEAAGKMGDPTLAPYLVSLARTIVDPEARAAREISKQPVFEENEQAAKLYWQILRSLSFLPAEETAKLLLTATSDFTPDKRAEALNSLNKVMLDPALSGQRQAFQNAVAERLSDPAAQVKIAALDAAGVHNFADLLPQVMKLAESSEVSTYKAAVGALIRFGTMDPMKIGQAVKARASQVDSFKRERYDKVLATLPPG